MITEDGTDTKTTKGSINQAKRAFQSKETLFVS